MTQVKRVERADVTFSDLQRFFSETLGARCEARSRDLVVSEQCYNALIGDWEPCEEVVEEFSYMSCPVPDLDASPVSILVRESRGVGVTDARFDLTCSHQRSGAYRCYSSDVDFAFSVERRDHAVKAADGDVLTYIDDMSERSRGLLLCFFEGFRKFAMSWTPASW